ncbi:MAG: hypothetical protein ACRBB6_04330 [Neptuniibacter sp.]
MKYVVPNALVTVAEKVLEARYYVQHRGADSQEDYEYLNQCENQLMVEASCHAVEAGLIRNPEFNLKELEEAATDKAEETTGYRFCW